MQRAVHLVKQCLQFRWMAIEVFISLFLFIYLFIFLKCFTEYLLAWHPVWSILYKKSFMELWIEICSRWQHREFYKRAMNDESSVLLGWLNTHIHSYSFILPWSSFLVFLSASSATPFVPPFPQITYWLTFVHGITILIMIWIISLYDEESHLQIFKIKVFAVVLHANPPPEMPVSHIDSSSCHSCCISNPALY